jgi:hypothetical protein
MRAIRKIGFVIIGLCLMVTAMSQTNVGKPLKIAVFAPVFLDSAFSGDSYKLGKNNLPRYMLPGLDFYNGVMLAIDSLNKEKTAVEVLFYDSKSDSISIDEIVEDSSFKEVSMIIASFNNRAEIKPLADFALEHKVPLLSATYPNDGDITGNPYFVIINPTLTAHLEGIYKFTRRFYPIENITLFRRKGTLEDIIQNSFNDQNKKTAGTPLKIKTVELTDSFTTAQVISYLDSNKQNIIICGTLNENFGSNLSKALGSTKNYRVVAIGMPTWDGVRDISKDLEIVYSTPYNPNRADKLSFRFAENYRLKFAGRPGDMAYKGFEAMYHFTRLLVKYGNQLIGHLSEKEYRLFNDFDFQPVYLNKTGGSTDYLENKKLYFIRKADGKIKSVN